MARIFRVLPFVNVSKKIWYNKGEEKDDGNERESNERI